MSDAVIVALITGPLVIVLKHWLERRDRALASEAVRAKDEEIAEMKATIALLRQQAATPEEVAP